MILEGAHWCTRMVGLEFLFSIYKCWKTFLVQSGSTKRVLRTLRAGFLQEVAPPTMFYGHNLIEVRCVGMASSYSRYCRKGYFWESGSRSSQSLMILSMCMIGNPTEAGLPASHSYMYAFCSWWLVSWNTHIDHILWRYISLLFVTWVVFSLATLTSQRSSRRCWRLRTCCHRGSLTSIRWPLRCGPTRSRPGTLTTAECPGGSDRHSPRHKGSSRNFS